MTLLNVAGLLVTITGLILWAGKLIETRAATKNKRKAMETRSGMEQAGKQWCVCGWRNETHDGPCMPYGPDWAGWKALKNEPQAPACGVAPSCNGCHDCPDLTAPPAPINTTHDSKLYMRGFEDGKALMQARLQSDRDALARHWEGE